MKSYSFILLIRGADVLAEQHADALFEAGCGDALFGERGGVQFADFDGRPTRSPVRSEARSTTSRAQSPTRRSCASSPTTS
jgi:hypothetical protein